MSVAVSEAEKFLMSRRNRVVHDAARAREVAEIDAALARIANGTYGTCEVCGGAIGRDRLRALPEVRRCVSCSG